MKLAKLSLAAIMAVGALSVANAQPLEDAIKGVDVSGYAQYQFNDDKNTTGASQYEVRAGFSTPVQEDISLLIRATSTNGFTQNQTAGSATASIDRVQVTYTGIANTTIIAGRQYAGTPLDDTAASGVKALYNTGAGLTLAAAYFSDDSALTNAIGAVAAIYSNDMFNARAWYVMVDDSTSKATNGQDHLFLEAGVKLAPVSVLAQYATMDPNAAAAKTQSTARIEVSGTVSNFGLRAGYITNDKDGGAVSLDQSAWGDNDLIGNTWQTLTEVADTNYIFGAVKTSFGKIGAELRYTDINVPSTAAAGTAESELDAQLSYNVSKQFSTYVRYADMSNKGGADTNAFRFQAKYSF